MPSAEALHLQLSPAHLHELRRLLRVHAPEAQVWVYGSRVMHDQAHEGSDLDLVLRYPDDLARITENLTDLREALQESSLPMLVDVHDWAALPSSFQREIERAYVAL